MKRKHLINEDKPPIKLPVVFSDAINKEIDSIYSYNEKNGNGLSQLADYIDGISNYLSYAKIAFDYAHRFSRLPNGCYFVRDFGYNAGYTIKRSKKTQRAYVYVFMLNLKTDEFGLYIPPKISLNISGDRVAMPATPYGYGADYVSETRYNRKVTITESDLRMMIRESLRRILYN